VSDGTLAWVGIAVLGLGLQSLGLLGVPGITSLGPLLQRINAFPLGRLLLILGWIFLGVHFFSRASVPPRH
jgi:hypothetical protein